MPKQENIKKYGKLLPALALVVGIAIAGLGAGGFYYAAQNNNRIVTVKGLYEKEVKANLAVWAIKFQTTGKTLATTQKELESNKNKIIAYLKDKGFSDAEILIGRVNTNDLMANPYRNDNDKGPQFIISQTISVRSGQVDAVEESLRKLGDLVSQGVVFDNQEYGSPVSYLFTGLNDIKPEMLQGATENAKVAANEFAKNSGSKVGKIKRANQGVFSILPREQIPGSSENEQIYKTVRVVSTLEYYLD